MNLLKYIKIAAVILFSWTIIHVAGVAEAKNQVEKNLHKKTAPASLLAKRGGTASTKGGLPPGVSLNACGCYRWNDGCICTTRSLKCECPGECEPVGCEARRKKQIEKEIADEEKRILDEEKRRDEAEKTRIQNEQKKRDDAERARLEAEEALLEESAREAEMWASTGDSGVQSPQDGGVIPSPPKASKKAKR